MERKTFSQLPLGVSDFHKLRELEKIYVDKTGLLYELITTFEKVFLARPRRFGKSLLVSTFESLFKYGTRDFKGLAIEKLWKDKTYKVIRLDFSNLKDFSSEEEFSVLLDEYFEILMAQSEVTLPKDKNFGGFSSFIYWLGLQPSNSVVVLIDEYDAPLTVCMNFDFVRKKLSRLYASFKNYEGVIRFLFLTGITKFNKTSIFSELNTLTDISLSPRYGSLLGYTHEEVVEYFKDYLNRSAKASDINSEQLLDKLVFQYDGFCFEETVSKKVFAPWSLLSFFAEPERGFKNYWFESGGRPYALLEYLKSHALRHPEEYGNLKSIALNELSSSSDIKTLSDVALLTQAGYLTLKNIVGTTAYVGYPNEEVKTSMAQLYTERLLAGRTVEQVGADNISYRLATENVEAIFHLLNKLFSSIDYQKYPIRDEASIRAFVQVFFSGAGLSPIVEHHNSKGRSDLEVKVGTRYWVFEFKVCKSTNGAKDILNEAILQLQRKEYGLQEQEEQILRVALVFSLEKRKFTEFSQCD